LFIRRLMGFLNGLGAVQLWLLMMGVAQGVTFVVMTPLAIAFHGYMPRDYVVTGFLACLFSAAVVNTLTVMARGAFSRLLGERQELQEALAVARRQEAIADLARAIAHDFNNLMQAVLANSSYLSSCIQDGDTPTDDELLKSLGDMELAATTAAGLVLELQSLAREGASSGGPVTLSTAPPAAASTIALPARLGQVRVLVVEDEALNRQAASKLLTQLGCEHAVVADGSGALSEYARFQPDLVLLDLWMPGMDGQETLARLRERFGPGVRVLFNSGHADAALRDQLIAGGDAFLAKPFDLVALSEAIEATLAPGPVPGVERGSAP